MSNGLYRFTMGRRQDVDKEMAGLGVAIKTAGGLKLGQSKVSRQLGSAPKEACQSFRWSFCILKNLGLFL